MSQYHHRTNHKVAEALVQGGLFDDNKNSFMTNNYRIFSGISRNGRLRRYYFNFSQRWRDAEPLAYSLLSAIKDYHIPLWFLKRHIRYIAEHCLWEKTYSDTLTRIWYTDDEKVAIFKNLAYAGGNGNFILKNVDFPSYVNRTRDKEVEIDGEQYFKKEAYKHPYIDVHTSGEMGIVTKDIANYYRNVQHRFYRIYGLDCKMCGLHVKHKEADVVDNELSKYIGKICPTCLKRLYKSIPQ